MTHRWPWIREIVDDEAAREIPLFGSAKPLDCLLLAEKIRDRLGVHPCEFRLKGQVWKEADDLKAGFKGDLLVTPISCAPLLEPLYWMFPKRSLDLLTSCMLADNGHRTMILMELHLRHISLIKRRRANLSKHIIANLSYPISTSAEISHQQSFTAIVTFGIHHYFAPQVLT